MDISEKRVEETRVAYIPYRGSYDKISELMGEVVQWVMNKKLEMTGMIYGTYYNTPDEVPEEELRYEVGVSFKGEVQEEGKIGIKEIPEHTVLAAMHKGPYTEVGPVIQGIIDFAIKNKYDIVGPVTEVYLNSPMEVPKSELLTEVRIPIIKR